VPDEPYKAEEVIELAKALQDQPGFQERQGIMENWDALRWRKMPVNILGISGKLEYLTPGIAAAVDRYRSRMFSATITISVAPKSTKLEDKNAAQRAENYFYRSFHDFAAETTEEEALDFQAWAGCGIWHPDWSRDVMKKLTGVKTGSIEELRSTIQEGMEKGFDGNPFQMISPHPQQVYWEPDLSVVAEVGEVKVRTAVDMYEEHETKITDLVSAVMPDEAESIWKETLEYYHLETEEFIYTVLGAGELSETVEVRPNPAHKPRYSLAAGRLTSSLLPHEKYRPLVHDLYPIALAINIMKTLMMSGALNTGRPLYQEIADNAKSQDIMSILSDPSASTRVITLDTSQGKMPPAKRGYHWEPVAAPTPDQLKEALAELRLDWDSYAFPTALSPEATELDAKSGYDRSQQEDVAVDFLNPALLNRARAWKKTFLMMGEMLQEIGIPVRLRAVPRAEGLSRAQRAEMTVKPTDFEDIDLEVGFSSKSRTARFAENEEQNRQYQLGLRSKSSIMANIHEDPVEEGKRIALDRMADAGEAQAEAFAIAAMQALQPLDMQAFLAQQAAVAAQPTNGAAGGPAPGETIRKERPPGDAVAPALGAPAIPPAQSEPGQ